MRYDLYEWQEIGEEPLDEDLFFLVKTKDKVVEAVPVFRKENGRTLVYWEHHPIALERELADVRYVSPPPPDPAFGERFWSTYEKPVPIPGQTFLIFHQEWMRWIGAIYWLDTRNGDIVPYWELENIGDHIAIDAKDVAYWTVLPAVPGQHERVQWLQSLPKQKGLPWC